MLDPVLCMGILQDTVSKEFIVWFFDFLAMKKSPFPLKSQWIKEKTSSERLCVVGIVSCGYKKNRLAGSGRIRGPTEGSKR